MNEGEAMSYGLLVLWGFETASRPRSVSVSWVSSVASCEQK